MVEIIEERERHTHPKPDPIGMLFFVILAGLAVPSALMFGKHWWPRVEPHLRRTLAPKRTVVEYERDAEGRVVRTKEWKEPIL